MDYLDYLIDQVIARAAGAISERGLSGQIVTFALYFDHEGCVLSVCADTLENSCSKQEDARNWSYQHLSKALDNGDLTKAAQFNHSVNRNLSLGDFALKRLAEHELVPEGNPPEMPTRFFVAMAQGLHRNTDVCLSICDPEQPIVLACSTVNDEVGLVWTPPRR